eukprot:TRINITY_DN45779_c0_g1_i1.p1 TRINITY_DN45779_c0_g1~~TRINITY_DN45779_c0_g1_i1.p1  ORF type:complete len:541 (+),score=57.49 TRINITY_DN45779_c0_g1_i1:32-1624(+)
MCRMLHFSLHCSVAQEQLLFLEDGFGKAHVVRAADINNLLSHGQCQQQISLVFVNACHSLALGVHFVNAGVKHVVCVKNDKEVRDESCRLFARDFYGALRAGRTVKEAFACGQAVLACSQAPHTRNDARSFVLLPEDADHSDTLVSSKGAPLAPPPSSFPSGTWGTSLPLVEDFLGREVDVHRLLQLIHVRRFVKMQGEKGIGKSACLTQTGRFLSLRCDRFHAVHWVDAGCNEDNVRQECFAGLERLRHHLMSSPSRLRVLLLIDNVDATAWRMLQGLLRFSGVHMVIAATDGPTSRITEMNGCDGESHMATMDPFAVAAMDNGLKPVSFKLGPIEPIAQAKLFLRRASRPLRVSELGTLHCEQSVVLPADGIVPPPQRPVDFLRLASSPMFVALDGNPGRIVRTAARLGLVPPESQAWQQSGETSMLQCRASDVSASNEPISANGATARRKVRLMRPDGRTRDVWLRRTSAVSAILDTYCPKGLEGKASAYVYGCHAPPDALLGDFPDDEMVGMLVFEFRETANDDDW